MLTIVIPTYWKGPESRAPRRDDLLFDHPTALDGPDTLTMSLKSLAAVHDSIRVVVITAAVHPELNEAVERRVEELIAPFREHYPIAQFAHSDLDFVRRRLSSAGLDPADLSLAGYPSIRNCQLIAPILLDADVVSAIDDDECVDPDFAAKARDYVGRVHDGTTVHGVAGRYFYEWGSFRVRERDGARQSDNVFARKQVLQNESYELFDARPGRLVETSIALGGNMVFSRELMERVPFDPLVPRGEDIDYLINSRLFGYRWLLDKELVIYHYPPPCNESHKIQEDVVRFLYERRKVRLSAQRDALHTVTADSLKPYPGAFFTDDLERHATEALERRTDVSPDEPYYRTPAEVIADGLSRADGAEAYLDYAERWRTITAFLSGDTAAKDHLRRKLGA